MTQQTTEIELAFAGIGVLYAQVDHIPQKGALVVVRLDDLKGDGYASGWPESVIGHWRVEEVEHSSIGKYKEGCTSIRLILFKAEEF